MSKINVNEVEEVEVEEETKVGKLPPYAIRYNELVALFGDDPDLTISPVDDKSRSCVIFSSNYHKIVALSKVLKTDEFLKIEFEYEGESNPYMQTIADAFIGNPHFDSIRVAIETMTGTEHIITEFKNETIQYNADNRFVPGGYETTLAEKIVKDLFVKEYRRSVYITKRNDEEDLGFDDFCQDCSGCPCK